MGWPQYLYLALMCIGVGMTCAKHGQPKSGEHDGWVTIISAGITVAILWAGGFFGGAG